MDPATISLITVTSLFVLGSLLNVVQKIRNGQHVDYIGTLENTLRGIIAALSGQKDPSGDVKKATKKITQVTSGLGTQEKLLAPMVRQVKAYMNTNGITPETLENDPAEMQRLVNTLKNISPNKSA